MTAQRLKLHQILMSLGTPNVYFQTPENIKMKYPCILYQLDSEWAEYANDRLYAKKDRYLVTVITPDPDNDLRNAVRRLPLCRFSRHFRADNLNHYVYNLYY